MQPRVGRVLSFLFAAQPDKTYPAALLTRGNVSCCDPLMYVTCQPCAALASHVEKFWCCDGHPEVNGKDRALPDGRFQLAFTLAEGPISALADPMGDGGGIPPSLLIGIRSRFSIIATAKLRSAMGVVFRPVACTLS